MVKRYVVSLRAEEKALLESMLKSGTERVRKMTHARILLRANDGWADLEIREALDVSIPTIQRVRYRFVEQSFEAALCPPAGWSSRSLYDCLSVWCAACWSSALEFAFAGTGNGATRIRGRTFLRNGSPNNE